MHWFINLPTHYTNFNPGFLTLGGEVIEANFVQDIEAVIDKIPGLIILNNQQFDWAFECYKVNLFCCGQEKDPKIPEAC